VCQTAVTAVWHTVTFALAGQSALSQS